MDARYRSALLGPLLPAVTSLVVVAACTTPAVAPTPGWQPPAGFTAAPSTVSVADGRTLRLWVAPTGWYVESLASGRHEGAVGAAGGRDQYGVSVVLDGLVGIVPVDGAQAVEVGAPPDAVRTDLHSGVFLVPATVVAPADRDVLVTPLDAAGRPIASTSRVPISGRG
ncbi:hypothetical protein [Micromonospora avicenniae]|uniref:hypothetical protein n=1 Tax=Micromonospora avicenniae TaxID=1198245 RepID=UPI0033177C82